MVPGQRGRLRVISVVFNLCKLIVGGIVFYRLVKTAEERCLRMWRSEWVRWLQKTCYCSLRWVSRNRLVFSCTSSTPRPVCLCLILCLCLTHRPTDDVINKVIKFNRTAGISYNILATKVNDRGLCWEMWFFFRIYIIIIIIMNK